MNLIRFWLPTRSTKYTLVRSWLRLVLACVWPNSTSIQFKPIHFHSIHLWLWASCFNVPNRMSCNVCILSPLKCCDTPTLNNSNPNTMLCCCCCHFCFSQKKQQPYEMRKKKTIIIMNRSLYAYIYTHHLLFIYCAVAWAPFLPF